jgi:hypothetical protein
LDLLPYRRRLFGRYLDLRRKKAARASEVRALGAPLLSRLIPRRGRRGGSKNNLSTMRAKKRTRCAAYRLRSSLRFCAAFQELWRPSALPSFIAATDAGSRRSRKPLMWRVKDG